jgi:hypothetical protein
VDFNVTGHEDHIYSNPSDQHETHDDKNGEEMMFNPADIASYTYDDRRVLGVGDEIYYLVGTCNYNQPCALSSYWRGRKVAEISVLFCDPEARDRVMRGLLHLRGSSTPSKKLPF